MSALFLFLPHINLQLPLLSLIHGLPPFLSNRMYYSKALKH